MTYQLTVEQQAIVDYSRTCLDLTIQAGAGTGKTSTLIHVAEALHEMRGVGLYIAFNKAIVNDAQARFPASVRCSTAHSLAHRAMVTSTMQDRLNKRMPPWDIAKYLGITAPVAFGNATLTASAQATLTRTTVKRFCYSDADEIQPWMVPRIPGTEEHRDELVAMILPLARMFWDDIIYPVGVLPLDHDHYLKMWGLGRPVLNYHYVMVDEAQDLNPVLVKIIADQQAQVIRVGDSAQAIYGWRGAVDAMSVPGVQELELSQSFRFGPAVAEQANLWLPYTGSKMDLKGSPDVGSVVADHIDFGDRPYTVLCRTNAGVISVAMDAMYKGKRVAVVGGVADLLRLVEAAHKLRTGRRTEHPDLIAFATWGQVVDYVKEHGDQPDLKRLVAMVTEHGTARLTEMLKCCVEEERAEVIVSTAHKAKGREWPSVRVHDDFQEPKPGADGEPGTLTDTDAMLAYVTVTRAQRELDRGGLAWIDRWSA